MTHIYRWEYIFHFYLFCSLNTVVPSPKPEIAADAVVWHLVKLFGNPHETGLRQRCTKLIQSLATWQPDLRDMLKTRRKSLDQAVQGMTLTVNTDNLNFNR